MSIERQALRRDPSTDQKLVVSSGPADDGIEAETKTAEQILQEFVTAAESGGAFLRKPPKVKNQAWNRQRDIVRRHVLEGENIELIGQSYSRPPIWVWAEFSQGIKRIWGNSSSDVQTEFPRETVLLALVSIKSEVRQTKRERLASNLKREDLNKEQLTTLMRQVDYEFFQKYRDLFVLVDDVVRGAGFDPNSVQPADFLWVLQDQGGIAVGYYHRKDKRGRTHSVYFVRESDLEDAKETIRDSQRPVHRRAIY